MQPIVILYFIAAVGIILLQPNVKSLNFNLLNGLALLACIAAIPIVLLYYKKKNHNYKLALVRFAHYMSFLTSTLYVFIFAPKYDAIYLSFIIILYFHWILIKGECIFTYLEQKIMDPNYIMGSNIYNHPWLQLLIGEYTNPLLVISYVFIMLNVSTVSKRYFSSQIVYYIIVYALLALGLESNIERYQRSSSVTSIGMS